MGRPISQYGLSNINDAYLIKSFKAQLVKQQTNWHR
jgi:hypothetical protein